MLLMKYLEHFTLLNVEHRARGNRSGRPHANGLTARQPSPKKSPGPRMATTASLPTSLTTESFTPPFCKYITLLAASP